MPIWLRKFTYNMLVEFTTNEKAENDPANGSTTIDLNNLEQAKRLMGDNATYTTKASKS